MDYVVLVTSILLAAVTVYGFKLDSPRHMRIVAAFAGGFLMTLTVLHLLPELYGAPATTHDHAHGSARPVASGLFLGSLILAGFFFQVLLDMLSMGVEHGHDHTHSHHGSHDHDGPCRFPWAMLIGLCLHAFAEALALGDHAHHHDTTSRDFLLWSIAVHKYPAAVALLVMLAQSGMSKGRAAGCLLIFGSMAPIGVFLGHVTILSDYSRELTALVVGIFLHISTTILFESSDGHRFNGIKALAIALGIGLAVAAVLLH
ncbi:MAG: ZIP family metal transporter [Verrucomicrobiae bacterium]|jgi:zinc and cadmium transporter|nr:ZIP family metal transporter [Verrucomicrobiae bacterium]